VEIVVVITMLGIAAAVALPRLTHLENDVRASQIVALSINLRNAAALAHDQYVRSGSTLTVATLAAGPSTWRTAIPTRARTASGRRSPINRISGLRRCPPPLPIRCGARLGRPVLGHLSCPECNLSLRQVDRPVHRRLLTQNPPFASTKESLTSPRGYVRRFLR